MNKRVVGIFASLLLTLVAAVAVVGYTSGHSVFSSGTADAEPKSTSKDGLLPDNDVGCIAKQEVDRVGKNQHDGEGFPTTRPSAASLPKPDDPQIKIEEPGEDSSSSAETSSDETNLEALTALAGAEPDAKKKEQIEDKVEATRASGEIPVCSGKSTRFDLPAEGEMVVDLDTIKERRPITPGEGQGTALKDPLSEDTLAQIQDFFSTKEADAQTQCDNIAVVKYGTWGSDQDVFSVAMSISNQLYNQFRPSIGWCVQVAWVTSDPNSVPVGYWPLFLTHTPAPAGMNVNYHSYGYWPIYPYRYSPYGNVPDTLSHGPGDPYYGDGGDWSQTISHEAIEIGSDPYAGAYGGWYTTGPASYVGRSGNADYGWEMADPVWPVWGYPVGNNYDGHQWRMHDFVLGSWYNRGGRPWTAKEKYYDGLTHVPGPLRGAPGGGFFPYYYPYYPYCSPPDVDNDCWYHADTGH